MFAGIIERICLVTAVKPGAHAVCLEVDLGELVAELKPGASVAINGVCLTLAESRHAGGVFDVVPETWRNTSLQTLIPGRRVNVERSLRVGDRIDGHFVQGHVDGVGVVQRMQRDGGEYKLWVEAPAQLTPCIVRKGSVALDGTSLTIVDVDDRRLSVALIPTTLEQTVLQDRRPGDHINIETDILARIVVSRLEMMTKGRGGGLSLERLVENGFFS